MCYYRLSRKTAEATDMDLVVLIDDPDAGIESSHFVAMVGDLLERVSLPPLRLSPHPSGAACVD